METVGDYINHYIGSRDGLLFLLVTLGGVFLIMWILYICAVVKSLKYEKRYRKAVLLTELESMSQRFYELIFSGGTILFFMTVYYLINRFLMVEPVKSTWDKYKDFILLFLIIFSILICRILDSVIIRLFALSPEDKSSIRLVAMVYMLLIFCYIKFIYGNDNYDMFITYFLGLMIGRFAYFDVSYNDIRSGLKGATRNLPLMLLTLAYLGLVAFYGFRTEYLIKHIGVLTNVFIIHLYTTVAIMPIHYFYCLGTAGSRRSQGR